MKAWHLLLLGIACAVIAMALAFLSNLLIGLAA